ncbi:hypothetical protein C483_03959 [Natrialba hulunbeirensis JCM 10989]|uniref:Uncharacterized protein n=1 Tax=Natrialba hulunbeirensis JCM 10989 TaxID=1227493 RepID=M0A625_9EURY|nr:hypothetical protein [Natrialba hulunbeirensis]ELY93801.1 hypothetical protein C483_03959 [Natrialba hulunbeirensis JCM 10989]
MSTKVSESTGYVPNLQMSAFGYVMAVAIALLLLPALPVIAVVWLLWRAFVAEDPPESSYERWRTETANRERDRKPNSPNGA